VGAGGADISFDKFVASEIGAGTDLVANLAPGLDVKQYCLDIRSNFSNNGHDRFTTR